MRSTTLPFLFGAQYYRAPTPEPACWEQDLARIRELGMNCVKFWVQWRWAHREDGTCDFSDLQRLCDLAHANGLDVHLNLIADVAPEWLYERHPDAKPVMADGRIVEPYEVGHRQLGGHPGPCYRHAGALRDRQDFVRQAVEQLGRHPAVGWFDVWNEPELCFPSRALDLRSLTCYCATCQRDFRGWLEQRYGTIERLNAVWGRCYTRFSRVEVPRSGDCVQDMIDWRHFQIDTMTGEARWRLDHARTYAPTKRRYLHVCSTIPTGWTQTATATDNFALAALHEEVFAASTGAWPPQLMQSLSAGGERVFYNTESHLNFGMTSAHPRIIDDAIVRGHFIPQLAAGVKGFMLWQFRTERLGIEAPAWGVVRADGGDRPATHAISGFFATLVPHMAALMDCAPLPPEIGLWESGANEVMHFCQQRRLDSYATASHQWHDLLHWGGWRYRCVDDQQLARGLPPSLKVLVMPCPYYLTGDQAQALDAWVRAGGVLLSEAHLGGYDGDEGRHSRQVPGFGLAQRWDLHEAESTAAMHLRVPSDDPWLLDATADVKKALQESGGGSRYFPLRLADGTVALGCDRVALLSGNGLELLAEVPGLGCIAAARSVGAGLVVYAGTAVGVSMARDPALARMLVERATAAAGITPTATPQGHAVGSVRVDVLGSAGQPRFIAIAHRHPQAQRVALDLPCAARGLFTGMTLHAGRQTMELPPDCHELLVGQ